MRRCFCFSSAAAAAPCVSIDRRIAGDGCQRALMPAPRLPWPRKGCGRGNAPRAGSTPASRGHPAACTGPLRGSDARSPPCRPQSGRPRPSRRRRAARQAAAAASPRRGTRGRRALLPMASRRRGRPRDRLELAVERLGEAGVDDADLQPLAQPAQQVRAALAHF